jgi:hypothetical protein
MEFFVKSLFMISKKRCCWTVANLQEGKNAVFGLLQTCRELKTEYLDCCKPAGTKKRCF